MYKYYGFGLNIASEIEMPELLPADFSKSDVIIKRGEVPKSVVGEKVFSKEFFSLGENEYILNVKDICRFYAKNGNTIFFQPEHDAEKDMKSIRVFMLGSVMAIILHQRFLLPMHASAIVKDNGLVLFMGESGAGKSTLLANMIKNGHRAFTDDICVLSDADDGKKVYGAASYPMIKLWEDAIKLVDEDLFNKEYEMRPHLPKFGQFFHDNFERAQLPVSKMFILNPTTQTQKVTCNRLSGIEAFKELEKQAYRYRLVTGKTMRPKHFKIISSLLQHCPIYKISRPAQTATLEDVYNVIAERI